MRHRAVLAGLLAACLACIVVAHPAKHSFLKRRLADGSYDTSFRHITHWRYHPSSNAVLSASPNELCSRNGSFVVNWSGISNPTSEDYVAVYSPANSSVHDYLDYFNVNTIPGYQNGVGNFTVSLINMRTDYMFRYFTVNSTILAQSETISVCSNVPTQIHIALTTEPDEMRIMWVSDSDALPIVRWGLDPSLGYETNGSSSTYSAEMMCESPANVTASRLFRDPGFIHDVLLTGLPAAQTIYYQVGDGQRFSEINMFVTQPAPGAPTTIKIIVYGDMGDGVVTPDARSTADRVITHVDDTDFLLHIGDISYARSIAWVWEEFFNLVYGIASQIPYMIGIGNHEYDHMGGGQNDPSGAPGNGFHPNWGNYGDDSNGECAVPANARFHMPDNGNRVFWYSFNYASVHVLHMSSEHDYTPGSPQYEWMQQDLAAVDRSRTPWIIFAGHRPMYTSEDYPGDYQVSLGMQEAFEDLLYKYSVDIAVWGHYHAYERTCAVYRQECQEKGGITHIVVGTAGASLDNVDWYPKVWSLNHTYAFGYGRITVSTDPLHSMTSLQWDFIDNQNDTVFDSVTLSKIL